MSGLQNGRDPSYGDLDWRRLAVEVRRHRAKDHRGIRDITPDIGITNSDFSRVMNGQVIGAGRVIALCRWMGCHIDDFYIEPENLKKSECFTGRNVKHSGGMHVS